MNSYPRSRRTEQLSAPLTRVMRGRSFERFPCVWPLPISPSDAEVLYRIPPTAEREALVLALEAELADARRAGGPPPPLGNVTVPAAEAVETLRAALAAHDAIGHSVPGDRDVLVARLEHAERCLAEGLSFDSGAAPLSPDRWADLAGPTDTERIEAELESALAALRQAEARDALLAARPAGCWCYGTGGRGRRWVTDPEAALCGQQWFYDEYCPCPEGTDASVADGVARTKLYRHRVRQQLHDTLGDIGVPPKYHEAVIENFLASPRSRKSFERVRDWWYGLRDGQEQKPALFIHGLMNVGKTWLACAILNAWLGQFLRNQPSRDLAAVSAGVPPVELDLPMFLDVTRLLDRLRGTYSKENGVSVDDMLSHIEKAPLVVFDDLGAEPVTPWAASKLFELLNARYNSLLPTIITSNLAPRDLELILAGLNESDMAVVEQHQQALESGGRPVQLSTTVKAAWLRGQRLVWRMVEMCATVKFVGDNLRDDDVRSKLGRGGA